MPRSAVRGPVLLLCVAAACSHPHAPAPPPPVRPTPAPPPPPVAAALRAVRVNETVLTFRRAGDQGTPVVFVHGTLADLDTWQPQLAAFARSHRVLTYSRRYDPPNPLRDDGRVFSPALHAEDLAALIQALGLAPAHVVGSGYGAYVALELALDHPDLVRTLVLGEPPILPFLLRTPVGDSLRRAYLAHTLEPARAAAARGDSTSAVRLLFDGSNGAPGRFDRLPPAARARLLAHAFEARRALLADHEQYHPALDCAALGRLAMPVLLLQGERSAPMYHVITTELARCLVSDTSITIPGADHDLHQSNPAAYDATVLRFLAAH